MNNRFIYFFIVCFNNVCFECSDFVGFSYFMLYFKLNVFNFFNWCKFWVWIYVLCYFIKEVSMVRDLCRNYWVIEFVFGVVSDLLKYIE